MYNWWCTRTLCGIDEGSRHKEAQLSENYKAVHLEPKPGETVRVVIGSIKKYHECRDLMRSGLSATGRLHSHILFMESSEPAAPAGEGTAAAGGAGAEA